MSSRFPVCDECNVHAWLSGHSQSHDDDIDTAHVLRDMISRLDKRPTPWVVLLPIGSSSMYSAFLSALLATLNSWLGCFSSCNGRLSCLECPNVSRASEAFCVRQQDPAPEAAPCATRVLTREGCRCLQTRLSPRPSRSSQGRSKGQEVLGRSSSHPDHHQQGNDTFQTEKVMKHERVFRKNLF
jgi:hypothetical protein